MRAIVTGATGFIGSWMVLELINNSYNVLVIVRDKNKLLEEIQKSEKVVIIQKDITELETKDVQFFNGADVCYNFAWMGVNAEQKNNLSIQLQNINMSLKMLDICNAIKCKKFISAGTVAEYTLEKGRININHKASPIDYYGAAKASTRVFLEVRARQLDIPFNWIIISSTYGERRVDNNILSYTIKNLINNKIPKYGKLDQMWDFMYVGETVRAIRFIGEKGIANKTYAVGSGENRTLKQFVVEIRNIINPESQLQISDDRRRVDTMGSCVDIGDLIKDTSFFPTVSFEQGIKKTINWFIKEIKGKKG